jgi:hypothetical protein
MTSRRYVTGPRYVPPVTDIPIEYDLLKDVLALHTLKVLDTKVEHFEDDTHVKIVMRDGGTKRTRKTTRKTTTRT